ncbi:calcium/calmodulin-dependent protein kinase [Thraustotheca clavata]|uniref:Calcium/calmodulin-dependent protein kinase n=1 Tax=Thraustotheca clavata TaxID=74557 RepID=A0A1W0AAL2_9STRA|nr:calcium/calmodulin-dependent protein kinase [Thraustotheca clavata]
MERRSPPEDFVRKPWQSFSTMKRFVSEAVRLENASWRIWYMQQRSKKNMVVSKQHGRLSLSMETNEENIANMEDKTCVYCELASASLTCNGCCHDPYCVSCFKLIHMRGHLASHTAVKIQQTTASVVWNTVKDKVHKPHAVPKNTTPQQRIPCPPKPVAKKPTQSWEEKMDVLFQKLMVTSMHHDGDISVHNIDHKQLHQKWTSEGKVAVCANCKDSHITVACPLLIPSPSPAPKSTEPPINGTANVSSAQPKASPSKQQVCANCQGNHITIHCPQLMPVIPEAKKTTKQTSCANCGGDHIMLKCPNMTPSIEMPPKQGKVCANCGGDHIMLNCPNMTPSVVMPSKKGKVCANCGGGHRTLDCMSISVGPSTAVNENYKIPAAASAPADIPKAKRKSGKAIVCGNCRGEHMTITCPQLQEDSPKHVVDSIVRKCFTSYHNSNTSNSTHAYLGDEVSVHGAFQIRQAPKTPTFFAPIKESTLPVEVETSPVLPALSQLASLRTPDVWILSSLWNELPEEFLRSRGHPSHTCRDNCLDELKGWVYLKPPHCTKWRRRYMVLYRNQLVEFLDENDAKPVGFCNVHEAMMEEAQDDDDHHEHKLRLTFSSTALRYDGRKSCMWCFQSSTLFHIWKSALERASRIHTQDLFGEEDMELGKGRFAMVKRAERKHLKHCHHACAIKIIDKPAFWDLVQQGVERDDTLFREVLTQSLLTLRGNGVPHHGYVVTLLSLFETHDHLVMEMELMEGGDIYDHIVTHGPLQESQAALVMTHLIMSIQFCLQNGIAHRDVKISNLALDVRTTIGSPTNPCVLKLADFGMGAFLQPNGMLLGRCGTPGYVAPEILTAGVQEHYPPHVDMFSAGVVLYTLLCGYEPFYAINDKELILLNKAVTYFFHPEEWSHISAEAKDLITRMLTKDPQERIRPEEALSHPFLKNVKSIPERPESSTCTKLF